jgi:DNA repair exonuclease SbcCD ATPase subunit
MILFLVFLLICGVIVFILLEQKNNQQEKDRQRNRWSKKEEQNQQDREDKYTSAVRSREQEVDQYSQRQKELKNSIISSLIVESEGIPLIPLKFHDYGQVVCIRVSLGKEDIEIELDRNVDRDFTYINKIGIPAKDHHYALNKIAKIIIRCHADIGNKIVYLNAMVRIIERLKKFIADSEYGQPNGLFPEDISQVYNLDSAYNDLYQKYNLLIFNVMKGDQLIGYTAENFPDISVTVATLDSEHNELTKKFNCLKQELDTYQKLKTDLESLGSYDREYRIRSSFYKH